VSFDISSPTDILGMLVGGVVLLLYGVQVASSAVQRAAGPRLRRAAMTLVGRPFASFSVGLLATLLTQSSGATSAMLVGLVAAQLVPLAAAVTMLLGANVGSTLVVQLLALHITDHAVAIAGLGAFVAMGTRRTGYRDVGQACFGFGIVLLGLAALAAASVPIAASPVTGQVLRVLTNAPLVLSLIGVLMAIAFASSAAAVGLVLVLAAGGALPLGAALAVVLGANVGTTAPALLAALSENKPAGRRLAWVHTGTKLAGAAVALLLLKPFAEVLRQLIPSPGAQVALAHLGFNVALAVVFVPLGPLLARVAQRLMPDSLDMTLLGPRYLDPDVLSDPALALGQATREVLRMADLSTEMLRLSTQAFEDGSEQIPERVDALDDQIDDLVEAIKRYLTQVDENTMSEEQTRREIALLYIITDIEAIGDIIDKQIMRLARRKRRGQIEFSSEGWDDLITYHGEITAALQQALAALATQDATIASEVLVTKAHLSRMRRELQLRHMRRLRHGSPVSMESSAIHLDLLNALGRVLSHTSNIAHAVRGDL
jgi:phosphate:Na+ symporter